MTHKWIFGLLAATLLFLTPSSIEAKMAAEQDSELASLTGKLTLVESHFLSTTIQVKKSGKKGGLRSVMAIVNSKTLIQYKGKDILLKKVPLQSTVHLEYERVKGVIVARTIVVKKLYVKPVPKEKKPLKK
jgi:hypothetical protein